MTSDELAAELYARQGYLVISRDEPAKIGEQLGGGIAHEHDGHIASRANIPIVVSAISNRSEFCAQQSLADGIDGMVSSGGHGPYYYRVEAMD